MDPAQELDLADGYGDLFRLVKRVVEHHLARSRAGIMLGLARLGLSPQGFLGGYFVLGSNAIVLNRDVLDFVRGQRPADAKAYAFHVLLHEYLHTLGYIPEEVVRPLAHELSVRAFGATHPTTLIAAAMTPGAATADSVAFFRNMVFPKYGWKHATPHDFEIVLGFDADATPYIG